MFCVGCYQWSPVLWFPCSNAIKEPAIRIARFRTCEARNKTRNYYLLVAYYQSFVKLINPTLGGLPASSQKGNSSLSNLSRSEMSLSKDWTTQSSCATVMSCVKERHSGDTKSVREDRLIICRKRFLFSREAH